MKTQSVLLLSLFFLFGCRIVYKDISNEPQFSPLIGAKYIVKEKMFIYGINLPPGYGKEIEAYDVRPISVGGISGPEVITEGILERGEVLVIKSINRSKNLISPAIEAIVTLQSYDTQEGIPIFIHLHYLQSKKYAEKMD